MMSPLLWLVCEPLGSEKPKNSKYFVWPFGYSRNKYSAADSKWKQEIRGIRLYIFIFLSKLKVFEVNCSSQRSGCHVLSQLKEATQSHLVEMSGKDPLKPIYFNNYNSSAKSETFPGRTYSIWWRQCFNANNHTKSLTNWLTYLDKMQHRFFCEKVRNPYGVWLYLNVYLLTEIEPSMSYQLFTDFSYFSLTGKKAHPKNVTSKRRAAQNFGRFSCKGKPSPGTVTLANYFKMKAKADHLYFGGLLPSGKPDCKASSCLSSGSDQTVPQNEKTATSLILFEEVNIWNTCNSVDMRVHVTQVWSELIHLQPVPSRRLMSYSMMMSVSSQPSRLSWRPLKGPLFWPPMVNTRLCKFEWNKSMDKPWCKLNVFLRSLIQREIQLQLGGNYF